MYRFDLRATTPIFLNGAEPDGIPEARAPSVRGQIRFWLRALEGAIHSDLASVWDQEERCLGSTRISSQVSIRFYVKGDPEWIDTRVLRHGTKKFTRKALKPGQQFELQVVSRPGQPVPKTVLDAVKLWLLLGGIGKRSRRMFGAFEVMNWDKAVWGVGKPLTPAMYQSLVTSCIQSAAGTAEALKHVYRESPSFSTLNPAYSRVLISNDGWDHWEDAMLYLFEDWIRSPQQNKQVFIRKGDSFGYADGNDRRASPLIAQVRRIGDEHYPVLTLMQSDFQGSKEMDWTVLRQFMKGIGADLNALTAWGTL